jgi:hypothetical protein
MPKKTKWLVILLIIRGIMPFTFYRHDNMIFAHQVKWLKVAMQLSLVVVARISYQSENNEFR